MSILVEWGVIKGNPKKKINRLNGIHKNLAHSWDERDVYYRIRSKDKIVEFREEAKEV
jgi:hypothetical protein